MNKRNVRVVAAVGTSLAALLVVALATALATDSLVATSVDALLSSYPLREGTASKNTEIGRTEGTSVHFVQTRTGVKAHFHRDHDEVVYVISGRGTFVLGAEGALAGQAAGRKSAIAGGRSVPVRPGSIFVISRGTPHELQVEGHDAIVALSVYSPAFTDNDRIFLSD